MKYLSLFSGIGAFESAMKNLDIPFDLVGFSEIDKYAVKSYCAIHNVPELLNLGDITKIDEKKLGKVDFITYGFPCQDISLAGKQQGLFNEDGSKTRSGLFFDALRIIEQTQPVVAIAENVKNLTSKKFAEQFQIVLNSLEEVGYNNYWMVLNSKDFGIPQNRERVFIVSIRKDVDTGAFEFPKPYPLKLRLKDMLEDVVDEKYYLSNIQMSKIIAWKARQRPFEKVNGNNSIVQTLTARGAGENHSGMVIYSPDIDETSNLEQQVREAVIQRVDIPQIVKVRKYPVDTEKLVKVLREQKTKCGWTNKALAEELELPLTTVEHWFRTDEHFAIPEPEIWEDLKWLLEMDDINEFDESIMTFEEKEGVFEKSERHYLVDGIAPTLTSTTAAEKIIESLRIRKLTPKECFRLMGFKDEDFEKAEKVNSNTQLYKQAGNSIVVDVAEELLCMLFDEDAIFFNKNVS